MEKTKGPTPSKKAAAMRAANLQKAAAPSPATSDGQPVQQAKSTAYKNQVWMAEKSTNRKRAASNNAKSEHIKMPQIVTSDVKSNTKVVSASELFDSDNDIGALSGESDEHGTGDDSDDNLDVSDDDLKSLKADKKKLKEVLDLEQPQFVNCARSKSTGSEFTEDTSDTLVTASNLKLVRMREEDWPLSSWIIYSTSGKVNLTDQQARMQDMLRASITRILEYLVFENAYPDLEHWWKITGDILLTCTDDQPEFEAVRSRLMKDAKYPKGRISHFRNNGLIKGADMKVTDLLKKKMFIYPVNSKDEPIRSKPYQAPAILDTIAEAFFVDDTSVGVKFHEKLVSTVEDRPDERELPVAMVALTGTAVRSVIMQYSSEKYDRDFNCELYSGIYKTLIGILNGIFDTSERKYHVLMHSVYKTVYGSKANVVCNLETDEALMFLDIDAMPELEE
ncbi:uncharacterized protein F5147DRAFT_774089 [Suillus discolor]|uniref:DUF6532 domain-containing protein n=1 Tax=Suillus discolor TaxID=1912936 RepID=A0A9P7JTP8_9AGAM|nr:uncharacterized protein F5147DRAFT_774089 [Suillus discolor]KAG2107645.1 hypothetical protein F5147DRAFT_774089 [Suillus discolor]